MKIRSTVNGISKIMEVVSILGILFLMAINALNVCFRSLFNTPILGAYEMVCLASSVVIFFSMANTQILKGHVTVTFLISNLRQTIQDVLSCIGSLFGVLVCTLICWQGIYRGNDYLAGGEVSTTLGVPLYPFAYAMSFGFGMMGLVYIFDMVDILRKPKKNKILAAG